MRIPIEFIADPDCLKCSGKGILRSKEMAPGVSSSHIRCGGPPVPMVARAQFCACVDSMPYADTSDLVKRYREERDHYREEKFRLEAVLAAKDSSFYQILESTRWLRSFLPDDNNDLAKRFVDGIDEKCNEGIKKA